MSEVKNFLEAMQKDPRAEELTKDLGIPEDEEKAIGQYIDLAKKLGFTISREDFISYQQEMEKEYQAKAEKAEASMEDALDTEQMKIAVGGAKKDCKDTHTSGEWCWYKDSCQIAVRYYDDWPRQCKNNY